MRRDELPSVWILLEGRAGDDSQMVHLAQALEWPYQCLRLRHNPLAVVVWDRICDLLGRPAAPLRLPPEAGDAWPDLVLGIGGHSVSTMLRIKRASRGRTRLLHLGRPWAASLSLFDLVLTTPQYGLPKRSNVVHNVLPLTSAGAVEPGPGLDAWRARFAHLPRPWTAVLVGGPSGSFRMDQRSVDRLAKRASALRGPGSILVTTSPRTASRHIDALFRRVEEPSFLYRFRPGDAENPYAALLALADRFLVTGESASMLAEACSTRRPVEVFPLEPSPVSRALIRTYRWLQRSRLGPILEEWTARGLWIPPRDLGALHEALARRQERWARREPCPGDMENAVAAVRALVGIDAPGDDSQKRSRYPDCEPRSA